MKKLFTIICFLTVAIASAQWTTDTDVNTLVAASNALDMQAVGTSDGQTYIVSWKNVGAPVNIELRMQVLDADGNQVLGNDGILVSDQIPMGTFTVLWDMKIDSEDNLYIALTGTGSGNPAFVFKMDIEGNHLWGANGVNIGNGFKPIVMPLSQGGAIVSWIDAAGAVMQKYDANGTAVWTATTPIQGNGGATVPGNLFEIAGGDYIAVFHVLSSGVNSNLYAQRYTTDGAAVWPNAVQISNATTVYNRVYPGVQDGDVVYFGYHAAVGNRFDSYLQRINPDGTLPWGINGSDFDTSQAFYETTTNIAFSEGSGYVWAISRYTDTSQGPTGTYAQKFDKVSGDRMFTDSAKEIFEVGSDQVQAGDFWLVNDSPLFVTEAGMDNGATPTSINSVYLDENGDFAWQEETRPVATFEANKGRVHYTAPVNGQSVVVFVENKGSGDKIYAQNIIDEIASVEDFNNASIFFANPVMDEMVVKSSTPIEAVSIFNVLGQQVLNTKYNGSTSISIHTQNWKSGIYFMNISTKEGVQKGIKVIKQ